MDLSISSPCSEYAYIPSISSGCKNLRDTERNRPPKPCKLDFGNPCEVCSKTSALEYQISQAEELIATLKARRPSGREINARHDPLMSKLPPEVVSNIFIKCMEVTESLNLPWTSRKEEKQWQDGYQWIPPLRRRYRHGVQVISTPLQLATVCHSWRQMAFSIPQLWTAMVVDVMHDGLAAAHVELLKACLDRSGTLPLQLKLWNRHGRLGRHFKSREDPYVRAMIDALLSHSRRWADLEVLLPDNILGFLMCDPLARPKLTRLNLSRLGGDAADLDIADKNIRINAVWEHLTHLTVREIPLRYIDIQWNNITHINVDEVDILECHDVLQRTPQLSHFAISIKECGLFGDSEDELVALTLSLEMIVNHNLTLSLEMIVNHNLRFFEFHLDSDEHVAVAFLSRLVFSALDTLKLHMTGTANLSIDESVLSSFTQSLTCLRRLELLMAAPSGYWDVEVALRKMPTLQYLALGQANKYGIYHLYQPVDDVLESLAGQMCGLTKEQMFLPNLQELYIFGSFEDCSDSIPEVFTNKLQHPDLFSGVSSSETEVSWGRQESKTGYRRPLRSLCMTLDVYEDGSNFQVDPHTAERLIELINQGYSITIGRGPFPGHVLRSSTAFQNYVPRPKNDY